MSIFPDFLALRLACSSQQWIGFLPSLYCSRLHSARPAAYTLLGNEHQELMEALVNIRSIKLSPSKPQLQGVLEAQLAWQTVHD